MKINSTQSTPSTGRAKQNPTGLRVIPFGGLGEIGMNCMALEYEDEILIVDCGLLFSDLDHFGVELVIPDFTYLRERKEKVKGYIITHGHEDHIGALPFALKSGIRAPIFASNFSSLMIEEKLKEYGLVPEAEIRPFKMGDVLSFKHFQIKTVSVNHSIVDAAALIIDTPVGKVIHTGDFKVDPTPFYGHQLDEREFQKAGDEGVLLLLSDSTNVERCTHTVSESVIYKSFEQLFNTAQGMTIISMFSSNVARMGQIIEIAQKLGKKVALSGRSVEQNVRLGMEAGYLKDAQAVLINLADISSYRRDEVVVISTGSQGEYRSALVRVANGEHSQLKLQAGDRVLMSSRFIPGNEKAVSRMINSLFKQGAEVLYEAIHDIHTSGHATRPELEKMLQWTRPKFFIPVHGEYRHLVHHAKLARETGVSEGHAHIAVNGDVLEISPDRLETIDHFEDARILIESREGNDVSKSVLKDRRQMAEKGIVFALLVRNAESDRVLTEPEVILKGIVHESMEGWLIDEAKRVVNRVLADYVQNRTERGPSMDLQETIRIELRRFFNLNLGKKPTVVPIVLDL